MTRCDGDFKPQILKAHPLAGTVAAAVGAGAGVEGALSWRTNLSLLLRVGVADKSGVLRIFLVYWRPQLILKISQLFKTEHHE